MSVASTCHATLVKVAECPTTGPATPKPADATDALETPWLARNAAMVRPRFVDSSVGYSRTTIGRGRVWSGSKRPRSVLVPPTSPASTILFPVDMQVILLHLGDRFPLRSKSRAFCWVAEAVCPHPRPFLISRL